MIKRNGFTLLELLITVAIVGLLMAIALPSYSKYVLRSHRVAAINAILDLASREARYYTTQNQYATDLTVLGYSASPMPITIGGTGTAYYTLSVPSTTGTSFTLQAVPTSAQSSDTCGTYTYTDLGVKGISSGTLSDCWKQ